MQSEYRMTVDEPRRVGRLDGGFKERIQGGTCLEKLRIGHLALLKVERICIKRFHLRLHRVAEEVEDAEAGGVEFYSLFALVVPDCRNELAVFAENIADDAVQETVLRNRFRAFEQTRQRIRRREVDGRNHLARVVQVTVPAPCHCIGERN